jgi:hypothetical protein
MTSWRDLLFHFVLDRKKLSYFEIENGRISGKEGPQTALHGIEASLKTALSVNELYEEKDRA